MSQNPSLKLTWKISPHFTPQVDYHHDWINPSSRSLTELIPIVNETWRRRGIKVKQHHSEPRPGAESVMEKRAHADRCQSLPQGLPDDIDLMIEVSLRIAILLPVMRGITDGAAIIIGDRRKIKNKRCLSCIEFMTWRP